MVRKTGKLKRIQLYDHGNVECPICLVPFTREQVIDGKVVTLEHVPPKFMGGSARCLTCKRCNAETGRDIDQLAATTEQDVKVTVDIQGKKDSFYITLDGKERTPAFGGFKREDIRNLKNSRSGQFTMSIGIPNQEAVATSWLKTGYLAIFCLLGPSRGYDYARSRSAVTIRNQILNPLNQKVAGKYVMDGTENTPDADILLVDEPTPCWMVIVGKKIVVLPCSGESTDAAPLEALNNRFSGKAVEFRGKSSWAFQTFGSFRSIDVHLAGADKMASLLGMTVGGNLLSGKPVEGTCIRHEGESATLLLAAR